MDDPAILGVEVGAAIAILGLLLVFLPLWLEAASSAEGGHASQAERRRRLRQLWLVPVIMAVAATDALIGLLTLWGDLNAAAATGWLLVALLWLIVLLALWAIWSGGGAWHITLGIPRQLKKLKDKS